MTECVGFEQGLLARNTAYSPIPIVGSQDSDICHILYTLLKIYSHHQQEPAGGIRIKLLFDVKRF